MLRRILFMLTLLSAAFLNSQTAVSNAGIPRLVRYSGSLSHSADKTSGVVGVTFALYKEQEGGSPLWLETQNVSVDDEGHYSVLIGAATSDGLPADLFSSNEARWLGVKPEGQEEQPRVLLVSVPYAMKAGDAETLNGMPVSAFVLNTPGGTSRATAAKVTPVLPSTPVAMDISSSTGTTNQVAKWVNSTTLGNSLVFDNGTNVGINTTNPQSTLDVNGESIFRSFSTLFTTTNNFGPVFEFTNAAKPTAASWSFGVPGFANATSFFIYDIANQYSPWTMEQGAGANSLYFKKGGNVGLGTSSPANKLTVVGTIQSTSGGFKFPDGSTLATANGNSSVTTSVTYNGTTSTQIVDAVQNQAGLGDGFHAAGVPAGLRGDSTTTTGYAAGVFGSASSIFAPGVAGVNLSQCDPSDLPPNQPICKSYGVFGWSVQAARGTGVWGQADATTEDNVGVYGQAAGSLGTGVYGYASNSSSGDGTGVYGLTVAPNGAGIWGNATAATGNTVAVYGSVASTSGVAGQFDAPTTGTILLGRSGTTSFSNVFRVDSTGKGFFDGGTQTGGADFAESVDAVGGATKYEPGDVMMIDETGIRRLALSDEPYSTKVAGIYSTKPGVLATPHTMDAPRIANEVPLAIVGIVPCKVSAENGAIHAGDLLVSSSRPGYAMKGTDREKMLGAVVGKALGSLDKGTGTIEVLVSLH